MTSLDASELAAWLRLLETRDVGRDTARRLLASFGSPEGVFDASDTARRRVATPPQADALKEIPAGLADRIAATQAWLDGNDARALIPLGDPRYPQALLETADPPLLLYGQGRLELLAAAESIAVVGSRNPTAQGRDNARAFGAHFSQAGWTVVSGLALGIDGQAHTGALEGRGSTIAVVGTGLDRIYPARHKALAHQIAQTGLLMSELPLGTPPLPPNFPQRNRIIAGLTRGTLVVEAALQSGSLITARQAIEAGRDVFAVPGSIHSPQSRGCHALIKQGAKLVETAADVLEELQGSRGIASATPAVQAAEADDPLLEALGYDPVSLDALVARTGWSAAQLNVKLLELELAGTVARLPGQMFQRRHGA